MKKFLMQQRTRAYGINRQNILTLLDKNSNAKLLDLGCDDGTWTAELAGEIGTDQMYGYELIKKAAEKASRAGVKVTLGNLNESLPYKDKTFDVVHANQVIEHLNDTDVFLSEIYRVLKRGAYGIISTENLASWHNIFALLLGYMPFSLTNISSKAGAVGNPLAPHAGSAFWNEDTWQHQRIFTIRGLKELCEMHGFKVESILASGYYPLGSALSSLDPKHSAFIVIKIRKPQNR